MKTCNKCGETKPLAEGFYKNNTHGDGYFSVCKRCNKDAKHRRKYACTIDEYEGRMATSDCCEICESTQNLCYDHDHVTMAFRGVLCRCCNQSIGKLGDTYEGVMRAIKYLEGE